MTACATISQQIDALRRQLLLKESLSPQKKLLARYDVLAEFVRPDRYPSGLFIAACRFFPAVNNPIFQLVEHQKMTSLH